MAAETDIPESVCLKVGETEDNALSSKILEGKVTEHPGNKVKQIESGPNQPLETSSQEADTVNTQLETGIPINESRAFFQALSVPMVTTTIGDQEEKKSTKILGVTEEKPDDDERVEVVASKETSANEHQPNNGDHSLVEAIYAQTEGSIVHDINLIKSSDKDVEEATDICNKDESMGGSSDTKTEAVNEKYDTEETKPSIEAEEKIEYQGLKDGIATDVCVSIHTELKEEITSSQDATCEDIKQTTGQYATTVADFKEQDLNERPTEFLKEETEDKLIDGQEESEQCENGAKKIVPSSSEIEQEEEIEEIKPSVEIEEKMEQNGLSHAITTDEDQKKEQEVNILEKDQGQDDVISKQEATFEGGLQEKIEHSEGNECEVVIAKENIEKDTEEIISSVETPEKAEEQRLINVIPTDVCISAQTEAEITEHKEKNDEEATEGDDSKAKKAGSPMVKEICEEAVSEKAESEEGLKLSGISSIPVNEKEIASRDQDQEKEQELYVPEKGQSGGDDVTSSQNAFNEDIKETTVGQHVTTVDYFEEGQRLSEMPKEILQEEAEQKSIDAEETSEQCEDGAKDKREQKPEESVGNILDSCSKVDEVEYTKEIKPSVEANEEKEQQGFMHAITTDEQELVETVESIKEDSKVISTSVETEERTEQQGLLHDITTDVSITAEIKSQEETTEIVEKNEEPIESDDGLKEKPDIASVKEVCEETVKEVGEETTSEKAELEEGLKLSDSSYTTINEKAITTIKDEDQENQEVNMSAKGHAASEEDLQEKNHHNQGNECEVPKAKESIEEENEEIRSSVETSEKAEEQRLINDIPNDVCISTQTETEAETAESEEKNDEEAIESDDGQTEKLGSPIDKEIREDNVSENAEPEEELKLSDGSSMPLNEKEIASKDQDQEKEQELNVSDKGQSGGDDDTSSQNASNKDIKETMIGQHVTTVAYFEEGQGLSAMPKEILKEEAEDKSIDAQEASEKHEDGANDKKEQKPQESVNKIVESCSKIEQEEYTKEIKPSDETNEEKEQQGLMDVIATDAYISRQTESQVKTTELEDEVIESDNSQKENSNNLSIKEVCEETDSEKVKSDRVELSDDSSIKLNEKAISTLSKDEVQEKEQEINMGVKEEGKDKVEGSQDATAVSEEDLQGKKYNGEGNEEFVENTESIKGNEVISTSDEREERTEHQANSQEETTENEEKKEESIESDDGWKEKSDIPFVKEVYEETVKEVCEEPASEKAELEEGLKLSDSSNMTINEKATTFKDEDQEKNQEVNMSAKGHAVSEEEDLQEKNHQSEVVENEVAKAKESIEEVTEEIRSSVETPEKAEEQRSINDIPADVCISTQTEPEAETTENKEKNDEEAIKSDDGLMEKSRSPMVKEICEETVSEKAESEVLNLSESSSMPLNEKELASKDQDQEKEQEFNVSEKCTSGADAVTSSQNASNDDIKEILKEEAKEKSINAQETSEQNEDGEKDKREQKPKESANKIVETCSKVEQEEYTEEIKPSVETYEKEEQHGLMDAISRQTESQLKTAKLEEGHENSDNLSIKEVCEETDSPKVESERMELSDYSSIKLKEETIALISKDEDEENKQELSKLEQDQLEDSATCSQDATSAEDLQAKNYDGEGKEPGFGQTKESIEEDTEETRSSAEITTGVCISTQTESQEEATKNEEKAIENDGDRKEKFDNPFVKDGCEETDLKKTLSKEGSKLSDSSNKNLNEKKVSFLSKDEDQQKEQPVIPSVEEVWKEIVKEVCEETSSEKTEFEGLKLSDSSIMKINEKAITAVKDEDQEKDQEVNISTKDAASESNEGEFVKNRESLDEVTKEIESSVETKVNMEQQGLLHVINSDVCSSTQTKANEEIAEIEEKNDDETIENDDSQTKKSESPLVKEVCEAKSSEKAEQHSDSFSTTLDENEIVSKDGNLEKEQELKISEIQGGGDDVISSQNASNEDIKETAIGEHATTVAYFEEGQDPSTMAKEIFKKVEDKSIDAQEASEQCENGAMDKREQKPEESVNKQENIYDELKAQVEKELQEDTRDLKFEDSASRNSCPNTQELLEAVEETSTMKLDKITEHNFQESQSKTNKEIEAKLEAEHQTDITEDISGMKDEMSSELGQPKKQNVEEIQAGLTKTINEKTEDEITKKDEDVSHDSIEGANDKTAKEEKCILDGRTRKIEISTLEHDTVEEKNGGLDESKEKLTDLNETTSVELQEDITPSSSLGTSTEDTSNSDKTKPESESLPIEDLESVSEVQISEAVPKSEDSELKEECLVSETAAKEISSDEKTEKPTEIKQVVEHATHIEEEPERSSEKENITGDGKSIEDLYQISIVDETIHESTPQGTKEENVKQTPTESDERKWDDTNKEAKALENLETYGDRNLAYDSLTNDHINETTHQPEKSCITTEENVTRFEQIGENDSLDENRDMDDKITQENQLSSIEDCSDMVKGVILTKEVEQVPLEIQKEKEIIYFKEQIVEEDGYSTELQKKSAQNQKEMANEISYTDPIPVGNRVDTQIGQDFQAAEEISCESKASSTTQALITDMKEGTEKSVEISEEVTNDSVDHALRGEKIPSLEDVATTEPQVNLSSKESTAYRSESEKSPTQTLESVYDVQTPEVIADLEDSNVKEECTVLATAEFSDEQNVEEEQNIKTHEISSAEENEHITESKQVAEHPSALSLDADLLEEELGRSGEHENTTDLVADRTISDSCSPETEEKIVEHEPAKRYDAKSGDLNTEEKALIKENLELHGELKPTSELMIEDQVHKTKPQPEQSEITSKNIVNSQTLEPKLEHTSEKDLEDGKRDMEEDITLAPENQIQSIENQNETMKNVILTDKVAEETEKEKGRNEVKGQVSEEDNCHTELDKTSTSNQKELADEIEYSKPMPVENTEVTEVKAESQIELENIQAAEHLSCLSKVSSTIGASKMDINEGTGQTITIIGEVKDQSVDKASKDEVIPVLEDTNALELQVNIPEIESTDTPSNGQDSMKLKEEMPCSTQETIETHTGEESSEKLLDELEEIDVKEDTEVIAEEEKTVEESYQDAVAEVTVHERLPQTEEKLVSMVPLEELASPAAEGQTNELELQTDKTKVEHSSISNTDRNSEFMEDEFTKTFSEDQKSIKERYIEEKGEGNFAAEYKEAKSGNEIVDAVVVNEVLVEVGIAKESKSTKDNIKEEASCIHNQLTSATDEVCQIERSNPSPIELLETKDSADDTEDPKLMTVNLNDDMKQNVEKTSEIVAPEFENLENIVTEEEIIKTDAQQEKEALDEPQADDPAKTTSNSISSSTEQDIEFRSEESRGHGDMHKPEEKQTGEITSEVNEIVPEDREASTILTDNLQDISPKMLLEKHDPEITTTTEKIEYKIKEVACLSNENTGQLQVSKLNSEIDEAKQDPGDVLNKEREAGHPQEHISDIKFVDPPSEVEIREQEEHMHCGSQEPSEDNTLLSQNDKKNEDEPVLLSVGKEILQGVDKRFEEDPVIDVQKHEKDLNQSDQTMEVRNVDAVSNAVCSDVEPPHLDTKETTLEEREQKKEADENIESEILIEKFSDKVEKADLADIEEETEETVNFHHREKGDETNHKSTSTEAAIPIENVKSSDVELQNDMDVPVPKSASTRNPEVRRVDLEVSSVMDATADKAGYNKGPNNKTAEVYEAEKGILKEDMHLESTCDISKTAEEVSGMKQESLELDASVTPSTTATKNLEISEKYVSDDLIKIGQIQPEKQKYEASTSTVDNQSPSTPQQIESIESKLLTGKIDASHEHEKQTAKSLISEAEDLKATKASGTTEPQCSSEVNKEEKKVCDEKENSKTAEPTKIMFADMMHTPTKGNSDVAENLIGEKEPNLAKDQQDKEEADGENEDEEDNETTGSYSDAPVMVEASKDTEVKVHKKSHNILSGVGLKVKHSIAKVKKAITGKSSHPKPPSPKERD